MAQRYPELEDAHIAFIERQQLYFIGTAGAGGFVNVSPKGMDSFRVLGKRKVAWLNLTGSGNETAAHVLEIPRMTIMFCSFDKQPLILRLYGRASVIHPRDEQWCRQLALFAENTGARQIFELDLELVLTSCGYAVPYYLLEGERPTLEKWADNKGPSAIEQYWRDENVKSLDGKETGILDD